MKINSLTRIITILSFTVLASLAIPSKAKEADKDSCEKGSSMAEVYACLEDKRQSSLDTVFNKLALKFSAAEQSDLLKSLTASQKAWSESVKSYCDILLDAATPDYGLYAYDIVSTCRAQLYSQRAEELVRLINMVEGKNFNHWTASEDVLYHVKLSTDVSETHTRFEPEASHLLYGTINSIDYLINFPDDPVNSAKVIELISDLDADGMPEAIVATWPGGNCCGPRYYVVSPREEGFFSVQTHEDMQGFSTLEIVYIDGKPIIKLIETSPSENLTINNEILSYYTFASGRIEQLEKNINSAIVPSLAEITAKEMVDTDKYTLLFQIFLFDVDDDGEDESLICRRHPTTNQVHCDGFKSRIHGDIKLTQGCSRLGFIASKTDGLHDIVCGRNEILRFDRASMAYQ